MKIKLPGMCTKYFNYNFNDITNWVNKSLHSQQTVTDKEEYILIRACILIDKVYQVNQKYLIIFVRVGGQHSEESEHKLLFIYLDADGTLI